MLVWWRLDRLGRNLRHLILLLDELQAVGVAFVSLSEGIDATTPAGRLQLHVLGAIAEFERERIKERVLAGLQRARKQGKRLGRPPRQASRYDGSVGSGDVGHLQIDGREDDREWDGAARRTFMTWLLLTALVITVVGAVALQRSSEMIRSSGRRLPFHLPKAYR